MRRKVAFYTLGCKVNQSESQQMLDKFISRGWQAVEFHQAADAYIINTCTVTQAADQKSRKMIRAAKRQNPAAVLAVTGCYAETGAAVLAAIEEVDLLIPNQDKEKTPELVEALLPEKAGEAAGGCPYPNLCPGKDPQPAVLKGLNRTRATLKIQDGCRQFCTYCIIPYARGGWQSLPEERALAEAKDLAARGVREIVLLGIHLGAYGWERGRRNGLAEIFERLLEAYPQTRFRLGSLEPMEATAGLIRLIRDYPNACKHLHLPLQCGQDRILRAMNRPYTTAEYRKKAEEVRSLIPDIALTTDIMTGFPGETEEDFQACCAFAREMAFSRIHVFAYSRRPGTPADAMAGQVAKKIKEERSRRLIALGQELQRDYVLSWRGRRQEVLAEEEIAPGIWSGHSDNYLDITFAAAGIPREENPESREAAGQPWGGLRGDSLILEESLRGKILPVTLTGEPGAREGSWAGQMLKREALPNREKDDKIITEN